MPSGARPENHRKIADWLADDAVWRERFSDEVGLMTTRSFEA